MSACDGSRRERYTFDFDKMLKLFSPAKQTRYILTCLCMVEDFLLKIHGKHHLNQFKFIFTTLVLSFYHFINIYFSRIIIYIPRQININVTHI